MMVAVEGKQNSPVGGVSIPATPSTCTSAPVSIPATPVAKKQRLGPTGKNNMNKLSRNYKKV